MYIIESYIVNFISTHDRFTPFNLPLSDATWAPLNGTLSGLALEVQEHSFHRTASKHFSVPLWEPRLRLTPRYSRPGPTDPWSDSPNLGIPSDRLTIHPIYPTKGSSRLNQSRWPNGTPWISLLGKGLPEGRGISQLAIFGDRRRIISSTLQYHQT